MSQLDLKSLVLMSVREPATAARTLMAMQLPRGALWTSLFLMAVLNTLVFSLSNLLMPGPSALPVAFNSPAVYFFFVAGGLVLVVLSLYWTGRALGGQASMEDVMVLVVWLQGLRLLVQAGVLVLLLTVPVLSAILVIAAAVFGLWILVHFVDQAHRFGSLAKAAGVLVAGFLAMVLGLSLLLSLIGVTIMGGPGLV